MSILLAIAHFEGFYKQGSRSQRNNNPGNIQYGKLAATFNATLETLPGDVIGGSPNERARFAHFPDSDSGFACLRELLVSEYAGMTLLSAIAKYAPSTENDVNAYAQFVCEKTGLSLESILTTENIG